MINRRNLLSVLLCSLGLKDKVPIVKLRNGEVDVEWAIRTIEDFDSKQEIHFEQNIVFRKCRKVLLNRQDATIFHVHPNPKRYYGVVNLVEQRWLKDDRVITDFCLSVTDDSTEA